jgi:1-deoxy-D-xylulose-5-phosphate reductoisomerase
MKNICILGSTGSIGTQAIDIIRNRKSEYKLIAISGNLNIDLLFAQAVEFRPNYVAVMDSRVYSILSQKLKNYGITVLKGIEGLKYISTLDEVDIVLTSVVGMIGLTPTIAAIQAGKIIALANKETLVVGGELITEELKKSKSTILPVDSEHSAVLQCMNGEDPKSINRIILTASGGPFRGKSKSQLIDVTPEQAIKHPKWNMGKKISIDSATLMNKALEVIEAHWLFNVKYENIEVVVHPQSIIHSMVEYIDGSIIAQMSNTDMKHPIQYAFDYPNRHSTVVGYLDLIGKGNITFERPDIETFECLNFGYTAGKMGGTMPTVMNAANEEAVKQFLNGKIRFLDIADIIRESMKTHTVDYELTIEKIINLEIQVRENVNKMIK